VIALSAGPAADSRDRTPGVSFTANRPVTFSCSLDHHAAQACASPFKSAALADGKHSIGVSGVDAAGHVGSSEVAFRIDTKAPHVSFAGRVRKVYRTKRSKLRLRFRFHANESGVSFRCKADHHPFHPCGHRLRRSFKLGKHTLLVEARDGAGNLSKPARARFRVVHAHSRR
jgi:hypothetical protein